MKKFLLVLTIILTAATCYAAAANTTGGFQDQNGINKTTVSKAVKMQHNSYVTIQGNIVKQISDDNYLFRDSTGTITVELDKDMWQGQTVNTNDKLELTGEIEKKYNTVKLDVDSVKKLTK